MSRRGTRGDRRVQRSNVASTDYFAAFLSYVTGLNGILLSASSYTESGGNVTAFVDLAKPSRVFNSSGAALATPAADAEFNNQRTAAPGGTQYFTCNEAASNFIWLHNGPVWQGHVYKQPTGGGGYLWATGITGAGICMRYESTTSTLWTIANGAVAQTNSITRVLDAATSSDVQYVDPGTPNDIVHRRNNAAGSSVDVTFTPSGSAAAQTLAMFRRPTTAGNEYNGKWALSFAVPAVPSAADLALYQNMRLQRFAF